MRARRREINIFNLSLLDVLCGALGAFCFMMLVALPYYKPSQNLAQMREQQEKIEQLMRDIEKLKTKMADPSAGQDLDALLRQLRAQIKALQGQVNDLQRRVNQLTAEKQQLWNANQQLTATNKDLTAVNKEIATLLAWKKPFNVIATAGEASQNIDILVTDKTGQSPNPTFNAWLSGECGLFNQIRQAFLYGRGTAIGMVTNVPIGTHYKIYVRLTNDPTARRTTAVDSVLFPDEREGPPSRLPKVTLSPDRFWTVLGTITIGDDYRPIFKEATAEERDAEWKALTNSTPPPTATPTPPPSAESVAAAAAARERAKEANKKFNRLLQIESLPSEANEAEILALTEELLKELPVTPGIDIKRRQVESMRKRTLAEKLRREGGQPPAPTPQQKLPAPGPMSRP